MHTLKSPDRWDASDAKADRIGLAVAWVVLLVALALAGLWVVSGPSYEKCSALSTRTDRAACFETLRAERLKETPAKGGSPPVSGSPD